MRVWRPRAADKLFKKALPDKVRELANPMRKFLDRPDPAVKAKMKIKNRGALPVPRNRPETHGFLRKIAVRTPATGPVGPPRLRRRPLKSFKKVGGSFPHEFEKVSGAPGAAQIPTNQDPRNHS